MGNSPALGAAASVTLPAPAASSRILSIDALRGLERKTSLVFTLLKASVYSIVLQQQIIGEEGDGAGDDTQAGGVESRGEDEDGL